jgi:hypothetical protein
MAEQLNYYHDIYHRAVGFKELQGFEGMRWPKMVGTEGQNSPSSIGSYMIWQHPYLIYLAEQLYPANLKGY